MHSQRNKLTEKAIATQTHKDAILSNLAVIHAVDTKVVGTICKPRYISKLHNENIVITNYFLQMSPCVVNIWSLSQSNNIKS